MEYEQKYKEALEKLQEALAPKDGCKISGLTRGCIEEIFPELKESGDERIRKELIAFLNENLELGRADETWDSGAIERWIAWLEKQEQKSNSWKPTKEQYEALDYAYNSCSDTERGNYYEGVLETLIEDLHRLEKQGEQKQTWKPSTAQRIVIQELIEDKNISKVHKTILRGMFDEFKQFTNCQSSQFSSGHLLDRRQARRVGHGIARGERGETEN